MEDASAIEGDSGTALVSHQARLSTPSNSEISVSYRTVSGTARAGYDFNAVSGTLVFAPGETEKRIDVPVLGDQLADAREEQYQLLLERPVNASLAGGYALQREITLSELGASTVNAIAFDGETLAIGTAGLSQQPDHVYLVERDLGGSENWGMGMVVSRVRSGYAVALAEDRLFIGSPTRTDTKGRLTGRVSIYSRSAHDWTLESFLDGEIDSRFGQTLAAGGGTLAVFAPHSSSPSPTAGVLNVFREPAAGATQWALEARVAAPAPVRASPWRIAVRNDAILAAGDSAAHYILRRENSFEVTHFESLVWGNMQPAPGWNSPGGLWSWGVPAAMDGHSAVAAYDQGVPRYMEWDGAEWRVKQSFAEYPPADLTALEIAGNEMFIGGPGRLNHLTKTAAPASPWLSLGRDLLAELGRGDGGPGRIIHAGEHLAALIEHPDEGRAVRIMIFRRGGSVGTVIDDDWPYIRVSGDRVERTAGASSSALVTAQIDSPHPVEIRLPFQSVDGSASAPADYTAVTGILTIPAGETRGVISIPIATSGAAEEIESFHVAFGEASEGTLSASSVEVSLSLAPPVMLLQNARATEGDFGETPAVWSAALSRPIPAPIDIRFRTVDGSASAGSDYRSAQGMLSLPETSERVEIPLTFFGDTELETNETFRIMFESSSLIQIQGGWAARASFDGAPVANPARVFLEGDIAAALPRGPWKPYTAGIYEKTADGEWRFLQPLQIDDAPDSLGSTFAVHSNTLVAGSRKVNVYTRSSRGQPFALVTELPRIALSMLNSRGDDLAFDGKRIAVGNSVQPNGRAAGAGGVFIYEEVAGSWMQTGLVQSSTPQPGERFGISVDLLGSLMLVGAPGPLNSFQPSAAVAELYRLHEDGNVALVAELEARPELTMTSAGVNVVLGDTVALVIDPLGAAAVYQRDLPSPGAWGHVATLQETTGARTRPGGHVTVATEDAVCEYRASAAGLQLLARNPLEPFPPDAVRVRSYLGDGALAWASKRGDSYFFTLIESGAPAFTIADDDHPGITFSAAEANEGSEMLRAAVSLTSPCDEPVVLEFTTVPDSAGDGSDYSGERHIVVIPAGALLWEMNIPIINDDSAEPDESFILNLNSTSRGTILTYAQEVKIIDDDRMTLRAERPHLHETDAASEEQTLSLSIDPAPARPLQMNYRLIPRSASDATDFTASSGSLVFSQQMPGAKLGITLQGDLLQEDLERFMIEIDAPADVAVQGHWQETSVLVEPGGSSYESKFGQSAIAVDRHWTAIADHWHGKVFLYEEQEPDGLWTHRQTIDAPAGIDHRRGFGLDIDLAGDVLAISSPYADATGIPETFSLDSGMVLLYHLEPDGWRERRRLFSPAPHRGLRYGRSIKLTENLIAIAWNNTIELHHRHLGGLDEWGKWKTFSDSDADLQVVLALSDTSLVAGVRTWPSSSSIVAHIFERDHFGPNSWGLAAALPAGPGFSEPYASSASILSDDAVAIAVMNARLGGAPPAVLVFDRLNETWEHAQTFRSPPPFAATAQFGAALWADGQSLFVGAPDDEYHGSHRGLVIEYQRGGVDADWRAHSFYRPSQSTAKAFGSRLEGSGDTMAAANGKEPVFFRLGEFSVAIVDDDPYPHLSIADFTVDEDAGVAAKLPVRMTYDPAVLQNPLVNPEIAYALIPGSARADSDFTVSSGVAGGISGIGLNLVADGIPEADESFTVRLLSTDYGKIILPECQVTVMNDDIPAQIELLNLGTRALATAPQGDASEIGWLEPDFDDSGWMEGALGAGYESQPASQTNYGSLIGLAIRPPDSSSLYLRVPLDADKLNPFLDRFELHVHYDDGFAAYLNGIEIARRNAPALLDWRSEALFNRSDSLAIAGETIALPNLNPFIRAGNNVLALHCLNSSPLSSDMLMLPILRGWSTYGPAYSDWITLFPGGNPQNYHPWSDLDGDGVGNLLEQATGRNPARRENTAALEATVENQHVALTFNLLNDLPPGLTFAVQTSSSGSQSSWVTIASRRGSEAWFGPAEVETVPLDAERRQVTIRLPLRSTSQLARLKADLVHDLE